MNILIIGTTDILGGAAKVSWEIKKAAEKKGHTVSMFVADKRSNDPSVQVIPRQAWRKYAGILLGTDKLPRTDWMLDTPEYKNADIVHCHNLHGRFFNLGTLVKMSQEKTVIWTLHDEWAITPHCAYTLEGGEMKHGFYVCPSINTQPRILWDNTDKLSADRRRTYQAAKNLHIVSPSLWLKHRVEKTALGSHTQYHIPNGIDTSSFVVSSQAEAREKLGLPADKKMVLFLAVDAKNNTWKGWKYTQAVVDHFADDKEVVFLSVGNLVEHEDEERVLYRGHVASPAELALYYSAADVLLFTSIAENFPLVVLEAMSCGLPIVAFDVGGVKEVLTHKQHGYVAPYKNIPELIAGIDWVLDMSSQAREELSHSSMGKIRNSYDVSNMTEEYLRLYRKLSSRHE